VIDKVKSKVKKILPNNLTIVDLVLFILVITICYLLFQQRDLFITSYSSYAYLKGHFTDFYDYNGGINDYLPTIYIFFAIWNIPLKLFGRTHDFAISEITLSRTELIWSKLLLVVFYFATIFVIFLIGKAISGKSQKAKYIAILFATSPIVIFAVYIFGQYDIIGIFFTMLGFYYYTKRDYFKFSAFFSIAISIKYFPLIIFIPLLLLADKKLINIIKYSVIALSTTGIEIVFYLSNSSFVKKILAIPSDKTSRLLDFTLSPFNSSPYLVILFVIICLYAYIKDIDQAVENYKTAIFLSLTTYAIMFSTIIWHPQWLIIIMPFFALSYLFVKDAVKSYWVDIIGMFSFIYLVVNLFPHNVDSGMLGNGILRSLFSYIPLYNSQLFLPAYLSYFVAIFFVYLFSPLLIQLFQKKILIGQEDDFILEKSNNALRLRFYIGVAIFVIPSLFCALAPKSIARIYDPTAYMVTGLAITQSDQPAGLINQNISLKQSFIAENDNLADVSIKLATYGRKNNCEITLTLFDNKNNPLAIKKIDGMVIPDNEFYKFSFNPIAQSKGKMYNIEIKSNGTAENSITAWKSNNDVYSSGRLYINEKEVSGDLNIELVYDR